MARVPLAQGAELAVLQQAAEWYALLRGDTVSSTDHEAWRRWLALGPAQQQAWARVEDISRQFETLPAGPAHAAFSASVHSRRRALAVMSALVVAGPAWWLASRAAPFGQWTASHRTGVGETRALTLADGTRLWLDTASAVDVDYQTGLRRVVVHTGAILVDTAPDNATLPRPFVVTTAQADMQALGTRFSVRTEAEQTLLAMYEGVVAIRPVRGGEHRIEAGWQTRIRADGITPPQPASPVHQSWAAGILQADDMRLDTFISELARYRHGYLACSDAVAHLRLVGAYPLRDTDRVLDVLAETLPVRIRRILPWWVVVEPA